MFVHKIDLRNLRSIEHLVWEIDDASAYGWHVIIGDNGAGKSGLLRAVALALVGPEEALALRQDWNDWLRWGEARGTTDVALNWDPQFDKFSRKGKVPKGNYLGVGMYFDRTELESRVSLVPMPYKLDAKRHVWGPSQGWFSASYGPFRRFTGGDKDQEKLFYSNPKLARHLSVFDESVALSECLEEQKKLRAMLPTAASEVPEDDA